MELNRAYSEVKDHLEKIETVFKNQERLAICRQELAEVKIEMSHYEQENNINCLYKEVKVPSPKSLRYRDR